MSRIITGAKSYLGTTHSLCSGEPTASKPGEDAPDHQHNQEHAGCFLWCLCSLNSFYGSDCEHKSYFDVLRHKRPELWLAGNWPPWQATHQLRARHLPKIHEPVSQKCIQLMYWWWSSGHCLKIHACNCALLFKCWWKRLLLCCVISVSVSHMDHFLASINPEAL